MNKKWWVWGLIGLVGIIVLILPVYVMWFLTDYKYPAQFWGLEEKGVWDYFELLVLPGTIFVLTLIFQKTQSERDNQLKLDVLKQERRHKDEIIKSELLNEFFSKVNEYTLSKHERGIVRKLVSAFTNTALTNVDKPRQRIVLRYIEDLGYLNQNYSEFTFTGVAFSELIFNDTTFTKVSFNYCIFTKCQFIGNTFNDTNFSQCGFIDSSFENTKFSGGLFKQNHIVFRDHILDRDTQGYDFYNNTFQNTVFDENQFFHISFGGCKFLNIDVIDNKNEFIKCSFSPTNMNEFIDCDPIFPTKKLDTMYELIRQRELEIFIRNVEDLAEKDY